LLKRIVHVSPQLVSFIALLKLNLSKPQRKHVTRIADTVIVGEMRHKTLSALYEMIVDMQQIACGSVPGQYKISENRCARS